MQSMHDSSEHECDATKCEQQTLATDAMRHRSDSLCEIFPSPSEFNPIDTKPTTRLSILCQYSIRSPAMLETFAAASTRSNSVACSMSRQHPSACTMLSFMTRSRSNVDLMQSRSPEFRSDIASPCASADVPHLSISRCINTVRSSSRWAQCAEYMRCTSASEVISGLLRTIQSYAASALFEA